MSGFFYGNSGAVDESSRQSEFDYKRKAHGSVPVSE